MRVREPVVYAVLLVAALGFAYQTWTREDAAGAEPGSVLLWEEPSDAFVSARYDAEDLSVDIERRAAGGDAYLWARVVRTRTTYRRVDADSVVPTETVDTTGFVVGPRGEDLLEALTAPRGRRDLGIPDPERLGDYGLADSTAQLVVRIGDRERTLVVGGRVYALSDRYTLDPATGRVYVLPGATVELLEDAFTRLPERRLNGFARNDVAEVVVRAGGRERVMRRAVGATPGEEVWTAPDAPDRPDQTFANFMDRLRRLSIDDYVPDVDVAGLEPAVRVEYLDEEREPLGFLELFRRVGADGEPEYVLRTELTRVPTTTYGTMAEELAADAAQLF